MYCNHRCPKHPGACQSCWWFGIVIWYGMVIAFLVMGYLGK